MTINYKWLTFNCVTVFIASLSVQYYDSFNFLWTFDKTHVTLLLLGIYAACSAYLGYKGSDANFKAIKFHASRMTSIGLIGTVLAIILMLAGIHDVEQFRAHIMTEVSPVFITTLFGLGLSVLLSYQVATCFGEYEDE